MNLSKLYYIPPLFFIALLFIAFTRPTTVKTAGGIGDELISRINRNTDLPQGYNDLFAGSGTCALCHNSMVNLQGKSVAIANDWRSTMMANSAKDPLWQAKVSHEGLVNPAHKETLENVCTTCHAPVGNVNAHHSGQALYSLAEMKNDPLAMDGVQCTVCHQITPGSLGYFSGTFITGTNKIIWGPFASPFANPMFFNTGYTPVHSNHVNDSRLCASCHTLLTNSVDLNGLPTGEKFVEQAIYHEWNNSVFSQTNITCQSCHVPRIDDPVKMSSAPPWLQPRSPFAMHQHAGANVFMGRLLKENGENIGVTATAVQFDSTINRSTRMLQQQTLDLVLAETDRTNDTLFLALTLKNKAGHKFPSGFPSRRAWVEVVALTESGDTLFHSGRADENFNLIHENSTYEPHHNLIISEDQVQIYEMVMGDVNSNVTTVLERAYQHLKDNRLPPVGFNSSHYSYDTTRIAGLATIDPDFNKQDGIEGSGSDQLHYHIPLNQYFGHVEISARVYYQTINDKWLAEMFSHSSGEINTFRSMYENADRTPVLVAQKTLSAPAGFNIELNQGWNSLSCFITPTNDDIDTVLNQIINSLVIIAGDEGMIYPAGGIHTLTNFNPYNGYRIKLTNAELLRIRGNTLMNKQKSLITGWNLLPVLSGCDVEIVNLEPKFLNQMAIIVELAGWRVYWPDQQVFSLTSLSPGRAYLIKMYNTSTITFPNCY
ncbi:MAG: hypothetical protein IH598_10140 [Bacteroidales bacterium]|nr:hypothetical protein [Bacteroidales bacterium]